MGHLAGNVTPWIPSWDLGECYMFNQWRVGLDQMTGYMENVKAEGLLDEGIKNFIKIDMTYMIG